MVASIPAEGFTPAAIDAALKALAERRGLGLGKVAQPLRIALTGGTVSPGLGEVAALLGKARTERRLAACLSQNA